MKTVAVIFGGDSTEHDISIVTAIGTVIKALNLLGGYDVVPVYITKHGTWYSDSKLADISNYANGSIDELIKNMNPVSLLLDSGLSLQQTTGFTGRKATKKIDIVFPAMHGSNGEDGALMGLLQMAGVAYVGSDMQAGVIAMNKVLAKQIVSVANIPTPKMVSFTKSAFNRNSKEIIDQINQLVYPIFVKPAHLGSSIGISKVDTPSQLINAIEVALHFDDLALAEEAVGNLVEVTVPIMGTGSDLVTASTEQPLTKPEDFFDFDTKYIKGGGKKTGGKKGSQGYSNIPADLPDDLNLGCLDLATKVYRLLGCSFARIDLLVDVKAKKIYFNEVNPMPGSLYAHNWRQSGISTTVLVQKLLDQAEKSHADKKSLTTTFTTSFLKQF
jgi:D-alanine-D-alanine ligase